jgi:hypothetical protein
MKKNILVVVLISMIALLSACRSNRCNCPHFEKENTERQADKK